MNLTGAGTLYARLRRMSSTNKAKKYLAAQYEDLQITRGDGPYVFAADGRRYIDFVMGWCVGNLGWGMEMIRDKINATNHAPYVHPELLYRPWVDVAALLAELTPGELQLSYRATGGTEAVEIALQVAAAFSGRSGFLSIEDSYHGNSIATRSIGASDDHNHHSARLSKCRKIKPPLNAQALDRVETALKKREVAAFIMEPIIMNLAVMVPVEDFMTGVQKLCKKYGTLLIMDEVACGFGRTGKLFASEHYEIEPDILCMGKAITAGYAGMGATIVTPRVARGVKDEVEFWSTFGWHPMAIDAALANLRYMKKHKNALMNNVLAMSAYLSARLQAMAFMEEADIHIKGLAIGIELETEQYAEKIGDRCQEAGLLISAEEDSILLLPPLNVERDVCARAMDILEDAL